MFDVQAFRARMFARDLAHCLALADDRKRDLAARREACHNDAGLCALLLADAQRRGLSAIDWPEYFRNSYLND